ncbi:MAG TPA: hypothetical protein VIU63_04405, partial [Nitrospira sp.]
MTNSMLQTPFTSQRYRWLPHLIVLMLLLTIGVGIFLLRNVERQLVVAAGEELTVAAAEVSDKL